MTMVHDRNEWGMPFHPFSRVAVAWQILITLVDATYSAFLIPHLVCLPLVRPPLKHCLATAMEAPWMTCV